MTTEPDDDINDTDEEYDHSRAKEDTRNTGSADEGQADSTGRLENPPFPPGTLVAYAGYTDPPAFNDDEARLALTLPTPYHSRGGWWYGLQFVQFPERGKPMGGSMWSRPAASLRLPTSSAEVLAAARYHAAARVLAAQAELAAAEEERDALEIAVPMIERSRPGARPAAAPTAPPATARLLSYLARSDAEVFRDESYPRRTDGTIDVAAHLDAHGFAGPDPS